MHVVVALSQQLLMDRHGSVVMHAATSVSTTNQSVDRVQDFHHEITRTHRTHNPRNTELYRKVQCV